MTVMTSEPKPSHLTTAPSASWWSSGVKMWTALMLVLVVLASLIAPTLTMQAFSGGSENLNVATVLEMHRETGGGLLWVPTLKEKPRLAKPPLTAWTSASLVSDSTIAQLDSKDPQLRLQAYQWLSWQIRWPALVMSFLAALATAELARVLLVYGNKRMTQLDSLGMPPSAWSLADIHRAAFLAGVFFFACAMVLRFGRSATTDVQLMLWVTLSLVAYGHAWLLGRWWSGCLLGGLFMGLAFMSKGPVAFVLVTLPLLAGWVWHVMTRAKSDRSLQVRWLPIVASLVVMMAIGLPWYLHQFYVHGSAVLELWKVEVLREGATDRPPDPFWTYLSFLPQMLPLTPVLLVGGYMALQNTRRGLSPMLLALFLTALPIVVMSLFKDKNERYLLPLAAPAAVLCAMAVLSIFRSHTGQDKPSFGHKLVQVLMQISLFKPVLMLGGLAVLGSLGGSIGAALTLVRADGSAWFARPEAALALAVAVVLGVLIFRLRHAASLTPWVLSGFAMTLTACFFVVGYANDPRGLSPFQAPAFHIRDAYPNKPLYALKVKEDRIFHDLNIYLNTVVKELDVPMNGIDDLPLPASVAQELNIPPNALLIQTRRTSAPPLPPPLPGYVLLEKLPAGNRTLHIYGPPLSSE